jgi:hypothetical protein
MNGPATRGAHVEKAAITLVHILENILLREIVTEDNREHADQCERWLICKTHAEEATTQSTSQASRLEGCHRQVQVQRISVGHNRRLSCYRIATAARSSVQISAVVCGCLRYCTASACLYWNYLENLTFASSKESHTKCLENTKVQSVGVLSLQRLSL